MQTVRYNNYCSAHQVDAINHKNYVMIIIMYTAFVSSLCSYVHRLHIMRAKLGLKDVKDEYEPAIQLMETAMSGNKPCQE